MSARFLSAGVLGLALLALAPAAEATPTCSSPDRLMQWPTINPVWEFCFRTPVSSSGRDGSGIEISNVFYNGHLVFKRAHVPILNVLYLPGGCGCFRDWSDSEVRFEVIGSHGPESSPSGGYAEAVVPVETVCERGGSAGDNGNFRGVAAEKLPDQLILTTQMQAGWYRYVMRWKFFLDGRIQPWYGYSAVIASCISNAHTHHNYWRLDFDIDGAGNDVVQPGGMVAAPAPPGGPVGNVKFPTEISRLITPDPKWSVSDRVTGRGYRVVPGTVIPADAFAVSDSWALMYRSSEIDDPSGQGCAARLNEHLTNEPINNQDVVLWVRGGQFHQANELDDCGTSVYTLEPFGDWSP